MDVAANGVRFHCEIDGREGAPWVTFVTGMANDTTMWAGQAAALGEAFRILRFDLRGHGGSESPGAEFGFEDLVSDVPALWDALGIETSSLVGLGLGGSMAMKVAIDHGGRVDKLVPCCCRAEMTEEFAAIWPPVVETVKQGGMEAMVERTVQRWFTEDFKADNPAVLDGVRTMILRTDPQGYSRCIAAFLSIDFLGRLKEIGAPTLFVSGADDHLGGPPELMETLAAEVRGARHVSIPNAAHICNLQNEAGFNRELTAFLGG